MSNAVAIAWWAFDRVVGPILIAFLVYLMARTVLSEEGESGALAEWFRERSATIAIVVLLAVGGGVFLWAAVVRLFAGVAVALP